jgi:hypothetical protein
MDPYVCHPDLRPEEVRCCYMSGPLWMGPRPPQVSFGPPVRRGLGLPHLHALLAYAPRSGGYLELPRGLWRLM